MALVVFVSDERYLGLWLTAAVVARLAPRAFLSLPAGSLVDRRDVRSLLVGVELARAATMAVLSAVVSGDGPVAVVLVLVAISYTLGSPTRPAVAAIVPAIAGERHLAVANAVLSTIRQIMTFIGPLLGVAVAAWSPAAGFAVNAATFAVSALIFGTLAGLPERGADDDAPSPRRARLVTYTREGIAAVRRIPSMSALVTLIGAMAFVRGAEMVLHVYVVRDQLDADTEVIGLLAGAIGLGALIGMPVAARSASSDSPVRPVLASIVLTAIPTIALAFIVDVVWACAVLLAVGLGMVLFEVVIVVMVQRATPDGELGRVFGAINGAANTGKLFGAVIAPAAVSLVGLTWALVGTAVVLAVVGVSATRPLVVVGRLAAATRRSLAPRVAVLEGLAIFDLAPEPAIERIAADVDEQVVPAGTVLVVEGAEPDDLFVTRRGRFDVSVGGRHLDTLGPDDWFGEIGLLDRRPRTATVTATEPSTVWRIPGATFLAALEEVGAPPSALVDGIADRLAAHR